MLDCLAFVHKLEKKLIVCKLHQFVQRGDFFSLVPIFLFPLFLGVFVLFPALVFFIFHFQCQFLSLDLITYAGLVLTHNHDGPPGGDLFVVAVFHPSQHVVVHEDFIEVCFLNHKDADGLVVAFLVPRNMRFCCEIHDFLIGVPHYLLSFLVHLICFVIRWVLCKRRQVAAVLDKDFLVILANFEVVLCFARYCKTVFGYIFMGDRLFSIWLASIICKYRRDAVPNRVRVPIA
mmetsp:Transcript_25064/g.62995  ORF Transcript_25064/g.62995 Transcript_25064/m.62995 type:complete len:233 (+) Transcript_25064:438-1136(+)